MFFRNSSLLILVISSLSLLFAYFVEYVMHLAPCPLCIYQRYPYFILIGISLLALIKSNYKAYKKYFIITLFVSILLAGYHTGVERGIFELSSLCTKGENTVSSITTITDFKKNLYEKNIAMCNKPSLVILGFSMTEWNLLLNIFLLIFFMRKNA